MDMRITTWLWAIAFIALAGVAPAAGQALDVSKTANPELVGELARELQATPEQAQGAAGALFDTARKGMPVGDWAKVSQAVPGMEGLLKAAPSMAAGLPTGTAGAAAGLGGLAGLTSSFTKLGLKPEMVSKAIPILTNYVTKTGGASVGSLLASALK
jgi:hypothetical protein